MNEDKYIYYCDESSHLQNDKKQFMVLGYISVPYNRIKKIKEDIKALRLKHKNTLEIKWSNLTNWNYPFYAELVDYFVDRSDICFRAIIVDKNKYIANKCGDDYDKFYYLMYYQLLIHKLDVSNKYNIYLDIKDDLSSFRIEKLKEILNVRYGIIEQIQHVRSHEVDLLQLCDLFIGSIAYKSNYAPMTSTTKIKLIEKIEKRMSLDITMQTLKSETKFNIFKIKL
jgi:hypothetical protein